MYVAYGGVTCSERHVVWLGEQGYGYLGIQPFVSCVVPRLFGGVFDAVGCSMLSGVLVGGHTLVER
eukprot:2392028-Prymnesium_polylepis.1